MAKNRTLILAIAGAAVLAAAVILANRSQSPETISYSELVAALEAGRVEAITIDPGDEIRGTWVDDPGAGFVTAFPIADAAALADRATARGVAVEFGHGPGGPAPLRRAGLVLQILLIVGLGGLLILHLSGNDVTRRVGSRVENENTTFADVAGTQGAAEELQEIVAFLRDPSVFARMGARVPKGVLLAGPPGTGKTLLARAVAGEAGVPFFQLSGSEVTGFVVGLGAQRVRSLFARARKRGGVIFIDEIDALGGARGGHRSHGEDDRTLNQLLVEMDGFAPTEGVVVVGATNRPEDLDPALQRPGRFDRQVTVGLPTVDGREAILRLHADRRSVPVDEDVDFARLARLTPGSSGAELANLVNEAAIAAVRSAADRVSWEHIEIARDRMLLGKERVGFRAQEREWATVAVHEAGHALAGVVACPEDGLHKVTIQPRGRAMGVAHFAPDDDRHLHSRRYLEAQIIKGLGGRVAEEITFGDDEVTGGAESDLVHVNRIARSMVFRLGMGADRGLLVYDEQAPLAAETQARMNEEVRALLGKLYDRTRTILEAHRPALDALAAALRERETLDGEEALALLRAHGVTTRDRSAPGSGPA